MRDLDPIVSESYSIVTAGAQGNENEIFVAEVWEGRMRQGVSEDLGLLYSALCVRVSGRAVADDQVGAKKKGVHIIR